ncbi:MAG TPA: 4-alpha-glucanotransferase, partial [Steroidobacteraceae bacterium]
LGWYRSLDGQTARRVDFYFGSTPHEMPDALVRAALASVGMLAVLPVQDILALGSEARLNTPATSVGNLAWRLPPGSLTAELAERYRHLNGAFGRIG